MRKTLCILLILMLLLAIPVSADSSVKITLQPQNYQYPEYSVAMYTVEASGSNLHCTWYIEYEGKTYNLSDNTNGVEPWEGYAGENYGGIEDGNKFTWFFGGIEAGLNGAQIWCVIEDGHNDVTSQRAIITVQGDAMPPEILKMPAEIVSNRGDEVEFRCVTTSNSDAQLVFQWYETATGKLQDIMALDGETSDYVLYDSEQVGVKYYVCCVTTGNGGRAYSSVLPITILDAAQQPSADMEIPTGKEAEQTPDSTEAVTEPASENTELTAPDQVDATVPASEDASAPAQIGEDISAQKPQADAFPWWGFLLIGLGSAGAGVGAAFLLLKKKK